MKPYDILIAKLFACCTTTSYPDHPVLVDSNNMSDLLEKVFLKEGLLEGEEKC